MHTPHISGKSLGMAYAVYRMALDLSHKYTNKQILGAD